MKTREIRNLEIRQGDLSASISRAWARDAFDLYIWRSTRAAPRGSFVYLLGEGGLIEERFVPENEPAPRPTLTISAAMAPIFFRLMGEAADQIGVLPDVVATKVASLETEVKLLREMLERVDKGADAHVQDLRRAAFE